MCSGIKVEVVGDVPPESFARSGWVPADCSSVRRNYYPDYKYLEGLLGWYFGGRVSLSYCYRPGGDQLSYPRVIIGGEVVARGKISAETVVSYLEGKGVERLD